MPEINCRGTGRGKNHFTTPFVIQSLQTVVAKFALTFTSRGTVNLIAAQLFQHCVAEAHAFRPLSGKIASGLAGADYPSAFPLQILFYKHYYATARTRPRLFIVFVK